MQVEATARGYFGVIREPGEVFEVPEGEKAAWWKPLKKGKAKDPDEPPEEDTAEPESADLEPVEPEPKTLKPAKKAKAKGQGSDEPDPTDTTNF